MRVVSSAITGAPFRRLAPALAGLLDLYRYRDWRVLAVLVLLSPRAAIFFVKLALRALPTQLAMLAMAAVYHVVSPSIPAPRPDNFANAPAAAST